MDGVTYYSISFRIDRVPCQIEYFIAWKFRGFAIELKNHEINMPQKMHLELNYEIKIRRKIFFSGNREFTMVFFAKS